MPYNSLSHVESLSLGQIGIKSMRSLDITFTSTKARFLNANSSLIHLLHRDLLNSIDDLPLASASSLSRAFWSDEPIILNISNGSTSCALDHSLSEDVALITSAVSAAVAANSKVQRNVYQVLAENFLKTPLRPTLLRRCAKYLSTDLFPSSSFAQVDFFQIFHISNLMGSQVSVALLKTILGGWITARRVQTTARHCIFCKYSGEDSLQHYSTCDVLWHAIATAFRPFTASFDPLALLGLCPPSPYQIYGVYVAYHAYHSLRHRDAIDFSLLLNTIRAYMKGCKIHQHLLLAHLGKTRLKFLPPDPPLPTASSSSSFQRQRSSPPSLESSQDDAIQNRAMYRLRMPRNRQAVLRARGLPVGALAL